MRVDSNKEIAILKKAFPEAEHISPWSDKEHGIDYGVLYANGETLNVFVHNEEKGISSSWKQTTVKRDEKILHEPELMLGIWADKENKIKGWVFDKSKTIDYVLFTFDEDDSANPYIIKYADLQEVFKEKYHEWISEYGTVFKGKSEYCSVPVGVVFNSIIEMTGERASVAKRHELYGMIVRGGNKL